MEEAMFRSKVLFILFSLVVLASSLTAQVNWSWAVNAGGTNIDYGRSIAVDATGNSYVTGNFKANATFGSTELSAVFNSDIFVAKMDANGNWLWAVSVGAGSYDGGYDICLDATGNAYVAGYFGGTVSFGTHELISNGDTDGFVAKISTTGVWQWAAKAGGSGSDYCVGMELDSTGSAYAAGYFDDTAAFGTYSAVSAGSTDIFVAKLDNSGNWLGVLSGGGSNWEYSNGISLDDAGNAYVTGGFNSSTTFGTHSVASNGDVDVFIAKANPALSSWQWVRNAGGSDDDWGNSIKTDGNGNSYVTGQYRYSAAFGPVNLSALGSYTDVFVSKLDSSGDWLWANSAGGASGYDEGYGIDIDAAGNSYITGRYRYTCSFGTHDVTSVGVDDVFISKLNAAGNEWLWAISAGGSSGNDQGQAIFKDNNDLIYAIGTFRDAAAMGTTNLTSNGYDDVFVAKLQEISPIQVPSNLQISIVGNHVLLSWDVVAGCTYTVYSDDNPIGSFTTVEQTGISTTTWSRDLSGSNQFYRVTAND